MHIWIITVPVACNNATSCSDLMLRMMTEICMMCSKHSTETYHKHFFLFNFRNAHFLASQIKRFSRLSEHVSEPKWLSPLHSFQFGCFRATETRMSKPSPACMLCVHNDRWPSAGHPDSIHHYIGLHYPLMHIILEVCMRAPETHIIMLHSCTVRVMLLLVVLELIYAGNSRISESSFHCLSLKQDCQCKDSSWTSIVQVQLIICWCCLAQSRKNKIGQLPL